MAEIIPRGQIHLLKNVPLSPDYINTYWFSSATEQYNFFQSQFSNVTALNTMYQRKNRGWLRIQTSYSQVWNVSYMMFRNAPATALDGTTVVRSGYEDRWWYAFVDKIDYINDNVVEVHYTIDVIQSYMFAVSYEDTFVDRMTQATNYAGDNLIDEGLPIGEYVYDTSEELLFSDTGANGRALSVMKPIIPATINIDYHDSTDGDSSNPVRTTMQENNNGMLTGCLMLDPTVELETSDTRKAQTWLANLPGSKVNGILAILMCPTIITDVHGYNWNTSPKVKLFSQKLTRSNSLKNYTPVNKKLLTFPYNALQIVSSDGSSITFAYEMFADLSDIKFSLDVVYTFPVQGILYPSGAYKHGTIKSLTTIPLPTLPSCSWSNDTYKAWAAMNTGFIATSIAGSVVDATVRIGDIAMSTEAGGSTAFNSTRASMLSANASAGINGLSGQQVSDLMDATQAGRRQGLREGIADNVVGLTNDVLNVANQLIKVHNAKILPDAFNGSANNLATCVTSQRYGFHAQKVCVRADYAEQLDSFFTMYGYKQNKLMTLSHSALHNRSRFTYIKTVNMDVKGSIPADDKVMFCSIFDRGVRFWYDRAGIGSYASANNVLS